MLVRATLFLACVSLSLVGTAQRAVAQSCSGDIELKTPDDLAAFTCTDLDGRLFVRSSTDDPITDLGGLRSLCTVNGAVYIDNNPLLTSLEGLGNLERVGAVIIAENDALSSLAGLDNLTDIVSLSIDSNDALVDLTGLAPRLSTIENVSITRNAFLERLTGFPASLTEINDRLDIGGNARLVSLSGLEGLRRVGKWIDIRSNSSLPSLEGFADSLAPPERTFFIRLNDSLTSLEGFPVMTSIGEDLVINSNRALTSLSGIPGALREIGRHLDIENNDALFNLAGLPTSLERVGGTLFIQFNDELRSLAGMPPRLQMGGLWVEDSPLLTSVSVPEGVRFDGLSLLRCSSLSNLDGLPTSLPEMNGLALIGLSITDLTGLPDTPRITGSMSVNVESLTSLAGFPQSLTSIGASWILEGRFESYAPVPATLTTVGGDVRIRGAMSSLVGFPALTDIGGDFVIQGQDLTSLEGFPSSLQRIGGALFFTASGLPDLTGLPGTLPVPEQGFRFERNLDLITLDGFPSGLDTVSGDFTIESNRQLRSLAALRGLSEITGRLHIVDNRVLPSLDGLDGLATIGTVRIAFNPQLSACCALVGYLEALPEPGFATIELNGTGCSSPQAVLDACAVTGADEAPLVFGLAPCFPNPTTTATQVRFTLDRPGEIALTVYDALGRIVAVLADTHREAGPHELAWDTAALPSGVYVLRLQTQDHLATQRLTVVN